MILENSQVDEPNYYGNITPNMDNDKNVQGKFKIGDKYQVRGHGIHHNAIVTIVDPETEYWRAKGTGKPLGVTFELSRSGLVAAFNPAYPATLWWWFAPHALIRVNDDDP